MMETQAGTTILDAKCKGNREKTHSQQNQPFYSN